ncbi:hypothetical protein LZA78_08095 [Sinirhodobacter sp. WL0062]|uniref:DUF4167 domain-containing protein n=1 Tax=Rhodobacter flavimaris TaxID=2907145 RepID=A0ABS8YUB1_9RHOB|nr:hypothetical protein [Sinirhodobacter sp. WL0062]MCE5973437.1 hypothetical protein [Sinirhodobacter sp. WL0062]
MTRHITDHAAPKAEGTRTERFVDIERKKGIHPAVTELNQRPADRGARKVQEYLRIDREQKDAV